MRGEARSESGAVLPLFALLLVVLLGFAAFGVDLTSAYAETREARSTADAAVLAAALQYLTDDSPSGEELFAIVTDYVETNWGADKAPTTADWEACTDDAPSDYSPVEDSSGNPISECLTLKQVNDEPALLRLRLPDYAMPTSFASLLGFDTMDISAIATAELRYSLVQNILPVSVPANPRTEECLGTPPRGHLPLDPVLCDGATSGVFGILDTPFFGADDPHFTNAYPSAASTTCSDRTLPNEVAERASHSFAVGLDHLITVHPDADTFTVGDPLQGNDPPGADSCTNDGSVPFALRPDTGNSANRQAINDGLIGPPGTPSPANSNAEGRLRQDSSPSFSSLRLSFDIQGTSNDFTLDNVGLWEYLASGCPDVATAAPGRAKTNAMLDCLSTGSPAFSAELLESPRFAVVPELNYEACDLVNSNNCNYGNKWWPVLSLVPVYLHSTWYDCDSNDQCVFQPADFTPDPTDIETYSGLFNPGESDIGPCLLDTTAGTCEDGSAINANKFSLRGITAIVLSWDMLPANAENQLGGFAPFEVFLHDNE